MEMRNCIKGFVRPDSAMLSHGKKESLGSRGVQQHLHLNSFPDPTTQTTGFCKDEFAVREVNFHAGIEAPLHKGQKRTCLHLSTGCIHATHTRDTVSKCFKDFLMSTRLDPHSQA